MKNEVKSNLRWPGGKSKMMDILYKYFPATKVSKYLEVFTGGGSVLLYVIQKLNPGKVYANDIDANLVNYYREVKSNPTAVVEQCLKLKQNHTAESFKEEFTKLDRSTASGFFTANKTSFSGMNHNYAPMAFNSNYSESCIRKISDVSKVIQNVDFINSDFKYLDEAIQEPIEGYFIYLDPPYYGNRKVGLYGKKGKLHKDFDHDELVNWVKSHSEKNLIMISYDDSPYVREMYKDFNIYDFGFTYCMTNTGGNTCKTGKELVITNYEIPVDEIPLF